MWLETKVAALLTCLTGGMLMAQTPETEPADLPNASRNLELQPTDLWSSQLTQEAVDEFQTDSRDNYVVQKDVDWKPGTLTINPGSSITISLNGGSESAIQLTLNPDTQADLGVGIIPEGAPPCVVEIRSRTADFPKTTSIRLVDSQTQNGKSVQNLVREVLFDAPAKIESATVHYRYGVVSVSINDRVRMVSFVPRGAAPVRGIFLGTKSQPLNAMSLRRTKPDSPLTQAESQQTTKLQADFNALLELYQQGEQQQALEMSQRMLPELRPLLRKTAPGSLSILNDLAFLHFQTGKTEEAKSLYQETLSLYAELPGRFYPEVARTRNNDDQATASLMEKFYTNLLQHRLSKLDALREAQLQMLTEHRVSTKQNSRGLAAKPSKIQATKPAVTPVSRQRVPTPAYWAAFQLLGKW